MRSRFHQQGSHPHQMSLRPYHISIPELNPSFEVRIPKRGATSPKLDRKWAHSNPQKLTYTKWRIKLIHPESQTLLRNHSRHFLNKTRIPRASISNRRVENSRISNPEAMNTFTLNQSWDPQCGILQQIILCDLYAVQKPFPGHSMSNVELSSHSGHSYATPWR